MGEFTTTGTSFRQIVSVDWLHANLADPRLRLIDVRAVDQYSSGHIPGAIHWDMNLLRLRDSSQASIDEFQRVAADELHAAGVNDGDRVVFYEDFSGASAARGVWVLDYLGMPGSALLDGGLSAWTKSGAEISRDPTVPTPGNATISVQNHLLIGVDEILERLHEERDSAVILDTRSTLEYRIGTIPTSVHLEWLNNLDADGFLLPIESLRELYQSHGFDAMTNAEVATFCGGGYRAAHSYLVLKELGFPLIRNYAPSWGEWGQRADLPVERPTRH